MPQTAPSHQDVWLVVPLYNEGEVIADVLKSARKTFPNIVCVDDGSADDSAAEARRAGAVVVQHPFNLGQGAALQTGIDYVLKYTDGQYIVTFDADGQHGIDDAEAMVDGTVRVPQEPGWPRQDQDKEDRQSANDNAPWVPAPPCSGRWASRLAR